MSLREFSASLKNRATSSVIDRLTSKATETYKSRKAFMSSASILEEESDKFRKIGKKQGLTRLIVTEDSLSSLLSNFGVVFGSEQEAIGLYLEYLTNEVSGYKNKHFEFYDAEGEKIQARNVATPLGQYIPSIKDRGVIAVRGLNFSHDNTLIHITKFLIYAGAGSLSGMSLEDAKNAVSELYDRGHILATTTGRQLASIGGISEENDILDKIVQLSIDLDKASSSLHHPKYAKILASVDKDFTGTRMYMNLEFQVKRDDTHGKGNQDSADITRGLRTISSLRNMLDRVQFSKSGALLTTPITASSVVLIKTFNNLLQKIEKQEESIIKVLNGYISDPKQYVMDLKSSITSKEFIQQAIIDSISGKETRSVKVKHTKTEVYTSNISTTVNTTNLANKVKPLVAARKKELDNLKKLTTKSKAKVARDSQIAITNLETLLRTRLAKQIQSNMGTGNAKNVLNYRTGRFAESATIERTTTSRAGMVSVFYNYMRNPYGTFSEGGKQQYPKTRDPKLLISKSIREIGAQLVGNRMRAILV
jgi:hypothetical protein